MMMNGSNDGSVNSFYAIPDDFRDLSKLPKFWNFGENEAIIWVSLFLDKFDKELPSWVVDLETLNEWNGNDAYNLNIMKTLLVNFGTRHNGTNRNREINKRRHYLKRRFAKDMRKIKHG
jgi:hypothetical protein